MVKNTIQEPPTFDQMLEALQSRRSRRLLVNLAESNPRNDSNLIKELDVQRDEEEFLIRLHHVDLPKLEDLGFVEWDQQTGEIVKGPHFGKVQPLVKMMIRHEDELPSDWL